MLNTIHFILSPFLLQFVRYATTMRARSPIETSNDFAKTFTPRITFTQVGSEDDGVYFPETHENK